MPIQLKEIGLTVFESGIIYTVLPLLNFVVPPTFGILVEKFGHHKLVNLICIVCITVICIIISQLPTNINEDGSSFKNIFWIYLFLRLAFNSFQLSIQVMFQSSIAAIAKNKGGYGKQRIWSLVATMICNPLTGVLMTVYSKSDEAINYRPAFYLFAGFMVPLFVFVCFLKMEITKRKQEERKPIKQFLKSGRLWFFYFIVVLVGVLQSVRTPYFVMFYRDIRGPPYLLGILRSVTALANIPVAYFSNIIAEKIGFYVYIVFLVLLALRYLLISFIHDPWLLIPIYSLIPSGNIIVVANVEFAMILAPPGYLMTFVALASNANLGIGRVFGRLLGAFVWDASGGRSVFRCFSGLSIFTAIIAAIIYGVYKPLQKRAPVGDESETVDENTQLISNEQSQQNVSQHYKSQNSTSS
ncbi:major facilitator superfamily domain-containing protein 6-A-like protein [Leptotrombidium deliense]|uniref:Major facilitator superfamily domain-containing protein 6-A-like protein n=1 Tax=Leptotrombidium deliense TaxID=299467 RepID=A0A443ST78_9ACAR|nr:major facilitator superfamily domain-containing protein 6-A-like protein [Leptotrombidium deliense]